MRLIELLPGRPNDEIRVKIRLAVLPKHYPGPPENSQGEEEDDWDWTTGESSDEVKHVLETDKAAASVKDVGAKKQDFGEELASQDESWHVQPTLIGSAVTVEAKDDPDPSIDPPTLGYEALSYTWGSGRATRTIIVESQSCSPDARTKLAVTQNLKTALVHLRDADKARTLWVDAVCINQADNAEKGEQVKQMANIFRFAHRVVIWLGRAEKRSGRAFEVLWHLDRKDQSPLLNDDDMLAVAAVLQRTWFERLWVCQEVALARRTPGIIMQCGPDELPFSLFKEVVSNLWQLNSRSDILTSRFGDMSRLYTVVSVCGVGNTDIQDIPLWIHLTRMSKLYCKDPRDHVFAVLGLAPRRFAARITPDYSRTTVDAFRTTVLEHADHVQRLELFTPCFGLRTMEDLPSWVPDYTLPFSSGPPFQFAATTSRAHVHHDICRPGVLEVLGVQCATVSSAMPMLHERSSDISSSAVAKRKIIRGWLPADLTDFRTAVYKPTGEPMQIAYAATLTGSRIKPRFPLRYYVQEGWEDTDWPAKLSRLESMKASAGETSSPDRNMESNVFSSCGGRSFIQTDAGHIGLAPAETRPGK
jgi:hypothetical protein